MTHVNVFMQTLNRCSKWLNENHKTAIYWLELTTLLPCNQDAKVIYTLNSRHLFPLTGGHKDISNTEQILSCSKLMLGSRFSHWRHTVNLERWSPSCLPIVLYIMVKHKVGTDKKLYPSVTNLHGWRWDLFPNMLPWIAQQKKLKLVATVYLQ